MSISSDLRLALVEKVPEGLLVLKENELVYANSAVLAIFGYSSVHDLLSKKVIDMVLPSISSFLKEENENLSQWYETIGSTRDGKTIDVEVEIVPLNHPDATALLTVRDITDKKMKEREQALWIKELESLSIIDKTLLGETNLDTLFQVITEQTISLLQADWAAIVFYNPLTDTAQWKAVVGSNTAFPEEAFPATGTWHSIVRLQEIQLCDSKHTSALCALQKIQKLIDEEIVSLAIVPLRTGTEPKGALLVGYRRSKDFSEREIRLLLSLAEKNSLALLNVQLYADLSHREVELQKLAGVRLQAQEEERRKIAREIHDGLGQLLTAIKFNLEILEDSLPIQGEEKRRIDDMKRLLDNVMQAARELSYNLMPSVLDDFGLIPALQMYCDQVSQRLGEPIAFHTYGISGRLPLEWEIGLYRIVQESFIFLQKLETWHEMEIQLLKSAHVLRLTIEGATINKRSISASQISEDIEIVSIRERASLLGGIFSIDTSGEKSVLLCVEIPLSNLELHNNEQNYHPSR